MDSEFLSAVRTSSDVKFMGRHVRQVANLDRLDPRRMGVMAEAMQLWVAVANAASAQAGPDLGGDRKVLEIAQRGGAATHEAMRQGGSGPAIRCADAIAELCNPS